MRVPLDARDVFARPHVQHGSRAGTLLEIAARRHWTFDTHGFTGSVSFWRTRHVGGARAKDRNQVSRVIIRQYQSADEAACRACVAELQDAERQVDPRLRHGDDMADEYLREMHVRCREHAGTIFVAEHDSRVVGLAMVLARVPFESLDQPPGEYAVVAELVVRDGFRRQGIGRTLLEAAERFAREAKATELRIAVLSKNHPARRLYLSEDFTPYSEVLAKPLSSR